jgi:hypothetical protein
MPKAMLWSQSQNRLGAGCVTTGVSHDATRGHPGPVVDQKMAEKRHALEVSRSSVGPRRRMAADD